MMRARQAVGSIDARLEAGAPERVESVYRERGYETRSQWRI